MSDPTATEPADQVSARAAPAGVGLHGRRFGAPERRGTVRPGGWTRLERTSFTPTRRTGLHIVLGVVLYAGGANVAAGWVMALAGIVLGVIPWGLAHALRAAGKVDVRRNVPARATAGVPVDVALEVRVPTPATVLVHDVMSRAVQAVADPSAGRRLEAAAALERGVHETGTVVVDVSDPFGLFRVRATGDVPAGTIVLPPVPRVPRPDPNAGRGDGDGTVATRTGGVEAVGIREHVRGEPLRRVDWRATARHRQLIVREFASPRRARVRVVVTPGTWSREQMDEATALASGLAAGYRAEGHEVEVVADGVTMAWGPEARTVLAGLVPHAGEGPPAKGAADHPPHPSDAGPVREPGPEAGFDLTILLAPADGDDDPVRVTTYGGYARARGDRSRVDRGERDLS